MRKISKLGIFFCSLCSLNASDGSGSVDKGNITISTKEYSPDILGPDFEQKTFQMLPDYEGALISTLVRSKANLHSPKAVLYIHGYNDYFFQEECAKEFTDHQYRFYAVDLRKYGRSYQSWQYPFNVRNLNEYFADIDSALKQMQTEGVEKIILMGHSTGGLITSLYCNHRKNHPAIKGLILNSPFLDMNMSRFEEKIGVPLISFLGSIFKNSKLNNGMSRAYAESLLKNYHGEWLFDTLRKYPISPPLTFSWIRSIHKGHKEIQKKSEITIPILLLVSDKSIYGKTYTLAHSTGDAVLDVNDIKKYGLRLGPDVAVCEIPNALHDMVLSSPSVRKQVYDSVFSWLNQIHP